MKVGLPLSNPPGRVRFGPPNEPPGRPGDDLFGDSLRMSRDSNRNSSRSLGLIVLSAAMVLFVIWTDQSLVFPLGGQDQGWLAAILKGNAPIPDSLWIVSGMDRLLVRLAPREKGYLLLETVRRWMGILALFGIAVWVGRSAGWVRGVWVILLGVGLLPLRVVCASLLPHSVFLALFSWGCCFAYGRPWSKTGTIEQFGGGVLMGAAAFAAPLGWLFLVPILLRTLLQTGFRRNLERPFWGGLAVGLGPGLLWLLMGEGAVSRDLGFRPETWTTEKANRLADLAIMAWGWVLIPLLALGVVIAHRSKGPLHRESIDMFWPAVGVLLLGETDLFRASAGVPAVLLLSVVSLGAVGGIFVARKEQLLIPSLLVLGLGYHLFFSGLGVVRERQAHAREVGSLANLIVNHVPPGSPICLFRLNPLLECLEAMFPPREWRQADSSLFRMNLEKGEKVEEAVLRWAQSHPEAHEIWVDPKRMGEDPSMGGVGEAVKSAILKGFPNETYLGEHGAEIAKFPIPQIRGKRTTIPAPGGMAE